jgi:hypothetical protein
MANLVQQAGFTVSVNSSDGLSNVVPGTYTWTLAQINNTATSFNLSNINLVLSSNLQRYADEAQLTEETDAGGAHKLVLSMAIPEPVSMGMASALGCGLLMRRRRELRKGN